MNSQKPSKGKNDIKWEDSLSLWSQVKALKLDHLNSVSLMLIMEVT